MSANSNPSQSQMTPESKFWWSRDGVRLQFMDYTPDADEALPVILCLPGLTRNGRDFAPFAKIIEPLLKNKARLWCVDLRGRGESGWAKDPMSYTPLTYLQDIEQLIEAHHPAKLIPIGTSLGGIVSMLMVGSLGNLIQASILNDVGPTLDPVGLTRIRSYVGKVGPYPTWMHAAHALADTQGSAYPQYSITDWLAMAKRLARLEPNGRIVMDYDPKIAEPFKLPGGEAGVNLWPAFELLAQKPMLTLRGAHSDILSAATLVEMAHRAPKSRTCTVPNIGHAPVLDEPVAISAITLFLNEVLA
jgi:pimeloyl-ACP methyl ester carboxylesterase